jgi:hypothetical protein
MKRLRLPWNSNLNFLSAGHRSRQLSYPGRCQEAAKYMWWWESENFNLLCYGKLDDF